MGLLFGVFCIVIGVWCCHLERQALDYRALAEALRVQIYWVASGLSESVATSYLQQTRSEMSWIRKAVRACSPGLHEYYNAFARLSAEHQLTWLRTVGQSWFKGQQEYYERQHTANHRKYQWCHYGGLLLAGVGLLLALALVADDVWPRVKNLVRAVAKTTVESAMPSEQSQDTPGTATDSHAITDIHLGWSSRQPPHWLLILSGTLLVAGGLCIAYGERRAFEELARQYNRMSVLFAHSIEALQLCLDRGEVASAQRVLMAMGCEALTENASWLILRRARPFELPMHI